MFFLKRVFRGFFFFENPGRSFIRPRTGSSPCVVFPPFWGASVIVPRFDVRFFAVKRPPPGTKLTFASLGKEAVAILFSILPSLQAFLGRPKTRLWF